MFEVWGCGTYFWFAGFLAIGVVWIWYVLPETKGVSLEEMDRAFGSNAGEEDAAMLRQARYDVGLTDELDDDAVIAEKVAASGVSQAESV